MTLNAFAMDHKPILGIKPAYRYAEATYTADDIKTRLLDLIDAHCDTKDLFVITKPESEKNTGTTCLMLDDNEQWQLKRSLLSFIAAIDYPKFKDCHEAFTSLDSKEDIQEDDLFFDLSIVLPLPEKVHAALYGKINQTQIVEVKVEVEKPQTFARKIFNPTTLSVGALCALGAWYAAKNSSTH